MSTEGDCSKWRLSLFPDSLIPGIICLFIDSWKTFKCSAKKEDNITNKFYAHLINNKNRSRHCFRIDCHPAEIDGRGEEIGEIDLKISHCNNERIYFSFECKRLRVQFSKSFDTLAGKYVTEGMCRYLNGQYASGLDKGGMLGYVMDGNVNGAIQNVKDAINARKAQLYMSAGQDLKESSLVLHEQVKETFHENYPEGNFTIYHIFLPLLNCNMTTQRKRTIK